MGMVIAGVLFILLVTIAMIVAWRVTEPTAYVIRSEEIDHTKPIGGKPCTTDSRGDSGVHPRRRRERATSDLDGGSTRRAGDAREPGPL